jgi:hypothetical protein
MNTATYNNATFTSLGVTPGTLCHDMGQRGERGQLHASDRSCRCGAGTLRSRPPGHGPRGALPLRAPGKPATRPVAPAITPFKNIGSLFAKI